MAIYNEKTIARFWAKVDVRSPDDCWDWTASTFETGYGRLRLNNPRRLRSAHVIAYEIVNGPTNDLLVCHTCDRNLCCNPKHLWLGTHADNMTDMVTKGRSGRRLTQGESNGMAVLTDEKIREIRLLIIAGHTNTSIALTYGVSHSMISLIRRGKSWRHVE